MDRPSLGSQVVSLASFAQRRDPPAEIKHKLIVVMPDIAEEVSLAGRILELAGAHDLRVLLLGICPERAGELELRRKLVILAAFIGDQGLPVDIKVENGKDWLGKIAAVWDEGDLLACYAGEKFGRQRNSLSDVLSSDLDIPIYVLSGLDAPCRSGNSLLSQVVSWIGSIIVIAGFLWFQIKLGQPGNNAAYPVWLMVSVLAEIAVIWLWNSLSA